MSVQIYMLVILVMPSELMSILGTVAAVIGSIVIYIFPDAPGALDDIAAVCTLIINIYGLRVPQHVSDVAQAAFRTGDRQNNALIHEVSGK